MDNPPSIQSSPPLAGEQVAFTGTLASMTHRQACELVAQYGGLASEHVSRQTTMLVVGEEGCLLEADGEPPQRLVRFLEWQQRGAESRLVSESDWLRLVGLTDPRRQVQRLCTSAMLARHLGVPIGTIRRWERVGLVRPVKKVHRLSYFDFAEVAAARRLSELLGLGISSTRLKASLERIRELLPSIERPLAQLDVLVQDAQVFYRDDAGLVETRSGQRYFDFAEADLPGPPTLSFERTAVDEDRADWSASQWFAEGCRLGDAGDLNAAADAFRRGLREQPDDPVAHFQLAEILYRQGRTEAARERYSMAVELDRRYIEAWTQLGCVLEEIGELAAALQAFSTALDVHPGYADAHRHIASVLDRLGRAEEAETHWRTYLNFDDRGPWADEARERLGEDV